MLYQIALQIHFKLEVANIRLHYVIIIGIWYVIVTPKSLRNLWSRWYIIDNLILFIGVIRSSTSMHVYWKPRSHNTLKIPLQTNCSTDLRMIKKQKIWLLLPCFHKWKQHPHHHITLVLLHLCQPKLTFSKLLIDTYTYKT